MHDDLTELRRYAETWDGDAFAAVVQRHMGLVHAAALRQVNGDVHLARDVAQCVFTDLARRAGALARRGTPLAGWLYTSTHRAAANAVRSEQRRRRREHGAHAMRENTDEPANDEAWAEIRPALDAVMQRLHRTDREALVQRFFAGRSYAELAGVLGVSEDGARMRVERALGKLRQHLQRRGIRSTMAALGTVLATEAVAAPPAGLAASVTAVALAKAGAATLAGTALGIFGMTKLQTSITACAAAAGLAIVGVEVHEQRQLRAEWERAQHAAPIQPPAAPAPSTTVEPADLSDAPQEPAQLAQLRAERARLEAQLARLPATPLADLSRTARAPAGAAASERVVVDFSQLDVPPRPVKQLPPLYPGDLRGIPGETMVSFVITAAGEVTDIQAEDATHPAFALAAIDAVAQWKFSPGEQGGVPVNVRVVLPIRFQSDEEDWF